MAKRLTCEEFIIKAKQIHGDKYDYSKAEYINSQTKVCIICPKHGEFLQTPNMHLKGQGCPKCAKKSIGEKKKMSLDLFIEKSKQIHKDKYDYSKVNYVNAKVKVCIICSEHGEFWQTPDNHLQGKGCIKCGHEYVNSLKLQSLKAFKKKVQEKYGDMFLINDNTYKNSSTKMEIFCKKHGSFMVTPNNFLRGHKCPRCNDSKLETEISVLLKKNKISFYQKADKSLFLWLGYQHLDFYLPEYNIAIECQGGQHFFPVEHFGGDIGFKKRQILDKNKKDMCDKHNIKLLYYSNLEKYTSFLNESIYHNKIELLNAINSHGKKN